MKEVIDPDALYKTQSKGLKLFKGCEKAYDNAVTISKYLNKKNFNKYGIKKCTIRLIISSFFIVSFIFIGTTFFITIFSFDRSRISSSYF